MLLNHRTLLTAKPKVHHNLVSEPSSRLNILLVYRQISTFSSKEPPALLRHCPQYSGVHGIGPGFTPCYFGFWVENAFLLEVWTPKSRAKY